MLPAIIDRVIIDTSSGALRYILVTQTKHYIRISAYAYTVLVYVNSGMPLPIVAKKLSADVNVDVTPEQVQAAYYNMLQQIEKAVSGQQSTRVWRHWYNRIRGVSQQLFPIDVGKAIAPYDLVRSAVGMLFILAALPFLIDILPEYPSLLFTVINHALYKDVTLPEVQTLAIHSSLLLAWIGMLLSGIAPLLSKRAPFSVD